MARFSTLFVLASGIVMLASTHGAETASHTLWNEHHLQPSHLPWAWNQTSLTNGKSKVTNETRTNELNSTFVVTVGDQGELVFSPPSLNASIGSVVAFNFLALNHTLTQSTLANPCLHIGGFDSGFKQFNPTNISGKHVIRFKVQTEGMVFSLNSGGNHSDFVQNAHTAITAEPQPTLVCSQPASNQTTPNSTATAASTGTISVKVEPSSAVISPPISSSGNGKPVIGLGLVASLCILFL